MLMIVDQVLADLASRMSTAGPVQQMMAKMGAATKVIIIVMVMMLMISMIFMLMISMTGKDEGDTISQHLISIDASWCFGPQCTVVHNVLFGQFEFLATEQALTYLKICVLISHLTYICPSSFDCEELIQKDVFVNFKL